MSTGPPVAPPPAIGPPPAEGGAALARRRRGSPHPPRARLTVRVGVIGHRPNRLQESDATMLREQARAAFALIARAARDLQVQAGDAYAPTPPLLRVISSVAEGADRVLAEAGLRLDFELSCILPFLRESYELDFESAESREAYRALLGRATAVLELDGRRDSETGLADAYEAAGRLLVAQSDVLIAVWDGEAARGRGGTQQLVAEAITRDVPVIWIHANRPHATVSLVAGEGSEPARAAVEQVVERLAAVLKPPTPPHGAPAKSRPDPRAAYFAERQPRSLLPIGWVWRAFTEALMLRPRLPGWRLPRFGTATRAAWTAEWRRSPAFPEAVAAQIDDAVRPHYAWADGLATYYANIYRSAYVLNYMLGVTAVFLALLGVAAGWTGEESGRETAKIVATIVAVLAILVITEVGRRRRWHERWIDYRLLAECLRQFRFLAPIGRAPPLARPPAHHAYGDPTSTWMMWHLRAVVRETGVVDARCDDAYREAYRVLVHDALIGGQAAWHRQTTRRLERLDRSLRRFGLATFVGVLAVLILLLLFDNPWLTLAEAVLPALGGALAAVRGQTETERLFKRSEAMAEQLGHLAADVERLGHPVAIGAIAPIVERAAGTMIQENLDWRLVFQGRPLELPA